MSRIFLFFLLFPTLIQAADVVEVLPVTESIIRVTFDEGYIDKHGYGEEGDEDETFRWPIQIAQMVNPDSYLLTSDGDADFREGLHPLEIGRKSKGHDFSKKCKGWHEAPWPGTACNNDFIPYHYVYLRLPHDLKSGYTYTLALGDLVENMDRWIFSYSQPGTRSVAVHTNQLGYTPHAPKYAYISEWMGDMGPLDIPTARTFQVYRYENGKPASNVLAGEIHLQKALREGQNDTHRSDLTLHGSFVGADIWEADFSELTEPGEYILFIEGVGSSYPFRIENDVYFEAFYHAARALYFERAGIARTGEYQNPAWKNRHLVYSHVRTLDLTDESGKNQKQHIYDQLDWGIDLSDMRGWYHDAGDWDGYYSHFKIPRYLMLSYELNPDAFTDGELNIPEAQLKNGYTDTHIPDLLDEAVWLVDYFKHNIGPTGGIFGSRVEPDISTPAGLNNVGQLRSKGFRFKDCRPPGIPSWEDCATYIVFGEDPRDSYAFASIAAQYAYCLQLAEKRTGEKYGEIIGDYLQSAKEAFEWAENNMLPGDRKKRGGSHGKGGLIDAEAVAAAWLYRMTREEKYQDLYRNHFEKIFEADLGQMKWAVWAFALINDKQAPPSIDADLLRASRESAITFAEELVMAATEKNRSMRMGGRWDAALFNGQGTTPYIMPAAVAYYIAGNSEKGDRYRKACHTTADYFLGGNGANMVWLTQVGHQRPDYIMHRDSEYGYDYNFIPGVPPYGPRPRCDWFAPNNPGHPHRGDRCYYNNAHDADFALLHGRIYPPYEEDGTVNWPVHELYFDNYGSPPTNEFTIHQTIGPAATAYGILCAPLVSSEANQLPDIHIQWAGQADVLKVDVSATDKDGWIYQVRVYQDRRLVGVLDKGKGSVSWKNTLPDSGHIYAIAIDNLGGRTRSENIELQ